MFEILLHHEGLEDWCSQVNTLYASEFHLTCVPQTADLLLIEEWPKIDILWHVLAPVNKVHLEAAKSLRLIQKLGVGVNTIDLEAAKMRGVAVCNLPGVNSNTVAEFTLGLMLSALRRFAYLHNHVRNGEWAIPPDKVVGLHELHRKIVGVVGFGSIGQRVAHLVSAFDAEVVYWSRTERSSHLGRQVLLEDLFATSDIVSLHIPVTEETRLLVGRGLLRRAKPGMILVNTARGELVDEAALLEALDSGIVSIAALDVFANEPLTHDSRILQHPNVLPTPHVAWLTTDCLLACRELALLNGRQLAAGLPLLNRVA